jgi:hypothetical protein
MSRELRAFTNLLEHLAERKIFTAEEEVHDIRGGDNIIEE